MAIKKIGISRDLVIHPGETYEMYGDYKLQYKWGE